VNRQVEQIIITMGHSVTYLTADESREKLNIFKRLIGLPVITREKFKKLDEKFDLLICNGEFGLGIKHQKAIIVFHGSYYGLKKNICRYLSLKQKVWMSVADHIQRWAAKGKFVVAVSEYLKEVLQDQGIRTDKIIENAIDEEKFKPLPDTKSRGTFLFVGQNHYYNKGLDIIERLSKTYGMVIDCLTGSTTKSDFYNVITPDVNMDMSALYRSYQILLFPSRFESSGLVALEAMACGLPVIMFDVGIGHQLKKRIPEFVVNLNEKDSASVFNERSKLILANYSHYSLLARQYVLTFHSNSRFETQWKQLIEEVANG